VRRPDLRIVANGGRASEEGWVSRLSHRQPGCVDVHLLLEDGSTAIVSIPADDAAWFEITPGQIVPLHRRSLPRDPRLALVGECIHVAG
jgi:hypothetical protein